MWQSESRSSSRPSATTNRPTRLITGRWQPRAVLAGVLVAGLMSAWLVPGGASSEATGTASLTRSSPLPTLIPTTTRPGAARGRAAAAGAVYAWGNNAIGQLGDGTFNSSSTAVPVSALTGVASVAAGGLHSLALRVDGTVLAWGTNTQDELGNDPALPNSTTPVLVTVPVNNPLQNITSIAAGELHSLAVRDDGAVFAWGDDEQGQLGDNTVTQKKGVVQVAGVGGSGLLSGATAVAAGAGFSLALLNSGNVVAWGHNVGGQLGDDSTTERHTPVVVKGLGGAGLLNGVTAIAAGAIHSLAILNDGTVVAWGANDAGQLGNNSTVPSKVPVRVTGLTNMVAIAAGLEHSLAVRADGAVFAWGRNTNGQLGNNSVADSHVPVQVLGVGGVGTLGGVSRVAAGGSHSLALLSSGTAVAWGINDRAVGEVGDGTFVDRHVPVPVVGLSGLTAIASGSQSTHSLAIGPGVPPVATPTAITLPATPTAFSLPSGSNSLLFIGPLRVLDTRPSPFGPIGFDGTGAPIAVLPFQDGHLRTFRIAGRTFQGITVPATAKGVSFNLTAVQSAPSGGFVTVFPGGAPLPAVSTLNPSGVTGTTSNAGVSELDAGGNLQIKSVGAVRDIVLDITGYFQ